jgi:hypothetical protein
LREPKPQVPGYLQQWEWFSQLSGIASDFSCKPQSAKPLTAPALGSLNTTAWAPESIPLWQDPSFLPFHAIVSHHSAGHKSICSPSYSSSFSALPSYSPSSHSSRLTCHTCHALLAIVLAAGILIDIVLVTSYCTTSHCLCRSESYANHVTKLAIILVASSSPSYSSPGRRAKESLQRAAIARTVAGKRSKKCAAIV